MKTITSFIDGLLFSKQSAQGFGLMRIGWAFIVLAGLLTQWPYLDLYYAVDGVMGPVRCSGFACDLQQLFFGTDGALLIFYSATIAMAWCAMIGHLPRFSVTMTLLMLWMFHMRNPMLLNGGDRMERIVGFYLIICPQLGEYTWWRIKAMRQGKKLPELTMPSWPRLLLQWQLIILYFATATKKSASWGWFNGTSIGYSFHLDHFMRFEPSALHFLSPFYTPIGISIIVAQLLWVLMLLPKHHRDWLFAWSPLTFKQALIILHTVIHITMFALMEIDWFWLIMPVAFLGLIEKEDIDAIKRHLKKIK